MMLVCCSSSHGWLTSCSEKLGHSACLHVGLHVCCTVASKPARNRFTSVCFNVTSPFFKLTFSISVSGKGMSFTSKTCQTLVGISMICQSFTDFFIQFLAGFCHLACMCTATVAYCNQPGAWNKVIKVLKFFSHTVSN